MNLNFLKISQHPLLYQLKKVRQNREMLASSKGVSLPPPTHHKGEGVVLSLALDDNAHFGGLWRCTQTHSKIQMSERERMCVRERMCEAFRKNLLFFSWRKFQKKEGNQKRICLRCYKQQSFGKGGRVRSERGVTELEWDLKKKEK